MTSRWAGAGVLLLLIVAIASIATVISRQFFGLDEHSRYSTAIRSMGERSEALNANILRLRFGFINHYDPLVEDLKQIKALQVELENVPPFIQIPEELRKVVANHRQVLAELEATLEELKTTNATLNNSLRFFPERASEFAREMQKQGNSALAGELNDLVRRVLLFNIGAPDVTIESFAEPLERLISASRDDRAGQELRTLGVHAQAIINAKPGVDKATRNLLSSRLHDLNNRLLATYSSAYDHETKKDRIYRLCLIPVTIVLLLSLALVFSKLRKSRDESRRLNTHLEERIRERTGELERKNLSLKAEIQERQRAEAELKAFSEQLEQRNRELKATQNQLVQAQKLEAVGQLAAGIAHEINTPTQFIGDNVRFLQGAFEDLQQVLPHCRQLLAEARNGGISPNRIAETEAAFRKADLEFLSEETPQAIMQTLDGIERIAKIVMAMKDFSHPGTKEFVPTDINRAIETTMTVTRNEWKFVAHLELDFDKTLPPVLVLPGEFNQVILNLVVNASHAIGARIKDSGTKGVIRISTRLVDEHCVIQVKDTGGGIPEAIRHRIFDPFFTTKEIGKGTGQGLTISRNVVVEKHGGSLEFESVTGESTIFIVKLPLMGKQEPCIAR